MVNVLTELQVQDVKTFMNQFTTTGSELRKRHGCISAKIFGVLGKKNQIIALFEWESREKYETFLKDPQVGEAMYHGGTLDIGKITYIEPLSV
jgi:quinol monooxygenase YgiN